MTRSRQPRPLIRSISKALDVLGTFTIDEPDLSLPEIAERVGVNKSTLFPILRTLVAHGYLRKNLASRRYRLGLRLLERAGHLREVTALIETASRHLVRLTETSQENSHLGVLDNGEVVYLDRKVSSQALMIHSHVGKRAPLHCTALGKVLLAGTRQVELDALLATLRLTAQTSRTITDIDVLRREIRQVRDQGYAVEREEYQAGGMCIAAPVLDGSACVVAAVSLSLPVSRCSKGRLAELIQRVRSTGRDIARDLGYVPESRLGSARNPSQRRKGGGSP